MLYEQRPDTVEAWKIIRAHHPDPMNGQDLDIEDGRTVHISAQDLSRSGVNPNPEDMFLKFSTGATTVVAKANFEKKWKPSLSMVEAVELAVKEIKERISSDIKEEKK